MMAETLDIHKQEHYEQATDVQPIDFPIVTIEMAFYVAILLSAAVLRFYNLSLQPLAALEATNAWAAWLAANGGEVINSPVPTSPLLYALHGLLLWVFGSGDSIVRFIPALFGTAITLLPWFMRHQIGRHIALFLALMLAIDPWLLAFSRLADGTILSSFFGLLTLVGLFHLSRAFMRTEKTAEEGHSSHWTNITAISLGLLIVSGSQAWNYLPVLFLFAFLFLRRPLQKEKGEEAAESAFSLSIPISTVILFAASALLGATGWLAFPEGLSYLSSSLSQWANQLLRTPEMGYELSWFFIRMWADQPFLLAFGSLGFLLLWIGPRRADRRWSLFLTGWLAWGLILNLVPGRSPFSLTFFALPLIFAALQMIEYILRQARSTEVEQAENDIENIPTQNRATQNTATEGGVLIVTLTILLFSGAIWLTALSSNVILNYAAGQASLIILLLAILLILFFTVWAGWRPALWSSGIFLGGLLLFVTLSNSWQLSHRFQILQPQGFFQEVSHPDARQLANDVATISAQRAGSATENPILVQMSEQPDPVLGWYLRKMQNLMWVQSPLVQERELPTSIVISFQESAEMVRIPENYTGSDYSIRSYWLPSELWTGGDFIESEGFYGWVEARWSRLQPLLRWMRHREAKSPPQIETILLWAEIGQ